MTIRVPNEGDAPISGKGHSGDLLVRINVTRSKVFSRQGTNLYHEVKIPMHTALLGGRVRVPTLDGDVDVRVPIGTQPGEEMVLKGRGVPRVYGGENGDLFVTFSVVLPRHVPSLLLNAFLVLKTFPGRSPSGNDNCYKNMRTMLRVARLAHLQAPTVLASQK